MMLNINKEKLNKSFIDKDYTFFFEEARKITDYLLYTKFNIKDETRREDMTQEALANLWKKVLDNKIDPTKNLMSFIWANSSFRALEIFRKEKNRNRIAPMISFEDHQGSYLEYEHSQRA